MPGTAVLGDSGSTVARRAVRGTAGTAPRRSGAAARLVSPLLRRILLVNALPLALLVAALLYLDQYQNGLLEAEVGALREQAKIYSGALGESAVRDDASGNPVLLPELARPLLRRLTDPTPNAQARVYAPDGQLVADSRVRQGTSGAVSTEPLPPAVNRGAVLGAIGSIYDRLLGLVPHEAPNPVAVDTNPAAPGLDWQPDVKEELRLSGTDNSREMPPYIRRTRDDRLLVTVASPVEHNHRTVGIILLTRDARGVDSSLFAIRMSILGLTCLALLLTVLLSWYLSSTIARPILRLADAAKRMHEGKGRNAIAPRLLDRGDEVGTLATALSESSAALWARMDAIEHFAADVAHEIKNPLSSIRSAIETLGRVHDPAMQQRLLAIVTEDVGRLDRLISDISDASRVDAELSRTATEPVDVARIINTLKEISDATRREGDPLMVVDAPADGLLVDAVEGRLVQVLRNLTANAHSFSPPGGRIGVEARQRGGAIEITVGDDGPGIPEGKLSSIFDRFYSERPQSERFGQHSGLGLSICKQIVEALHGTIEAENRRDEQGRVVGARFTVRLPSAG